MNAEQFKALLLSSADLALTTLAAEYGVSRNVVADLLHCGHAKLGQQFGQLLQDGWQAKPPELSHVANQYDDDI